MAGYTRLHRRVKLARECSLKVYIYFYAHIHISRVVVTRMVGDYSASISAHLGPAHVRSSISRGFLHIRCD